MPNIIELNLLENRSIVAKMQGIPLANENSYKIIAGEENATIFKVVSIPNQYADKSFTIEMVNAKGYGIEETPIVNITNYEFSLPVGMAVAGYAYVLFRAKYIENGKEVVVPFQPLKIKVWNTLPEWKERISNSTNVRIENGYLIINEDGKDYNLGYVKGEKGDSGDIASQKIIDDIQKEISDLYILSNATVTGTEEITDRYTMRQTANGLNGLIDGAATKVTEIKGSTVKDENLIPFPYTYGTTTINGVSFFVSDTGVVTCNGTATSRVVYSLGNYYDYGKTLYLSGAPVGGDVNSTFSLRCFSYPSGAWSGNDTGSGTVIRNVSDDTYYYFAIVVEAGFTCENLVFKPMLNEGTIAKKWSPRFNDLKHANISAIKSTGRNLFNSNTLLAADDWSVDANGVYSGETVKLYNKFKWDKGGILTINNGRDEVITVSFIGKCATKINSICVNFAYADGTYTLGNDAKYLNSTEFTKYVVSSKTGRGGVKYAYISYGNNNTVYLKDFSIKYGTDDVYEPYTEEIYQLPQELINLYPNGVPEYDRFYPQTGEIIRRTGYATSETGFTEEEIAGYDGAIVSSDKLSLEYKLATPTIEKIENAPKLYKAWQHGSETVIQGDIDNSEYGAKCAITQIYAVKKGVSE